MSGSDEFVAFLIDQLSGWGKVSGRKVFGLVADDVAYLKVGDSNREDLERAGSSPFRPYADRDVTMSYYEIPPDVLECAEELGEWAARSFRIQTKGR